MTLPQLLRILWARRRVVLAAASMAMAFALLVSAVTTKTYKATADLLIDLRAPDAVSGTSAPHAALAALVATQVDVISSTRVAQEVVRTLEFDREPVNIAQWRDATGGRGSIVNWLADLLLEELQAQADANGSVIRVSFVSESPERSARIANAFVNAYLVTAAIIKVDPERENADFFATRVKAARADLALAKERLSAYQRENDIIDASERFDLENERLSSLSKQLVRLESQQAKAMALSERSGDRAALPEVLANPVVQRLRERLAKAEGELRKASGTYGSRHPVIISLRGQVGSLRRNLEREIDRQASSTGVSGAVSSSQTADIATALTAQRQKVLGLKSHRDRIDLLRNDVTAAQKAYELVAERSALSSLQSQSRQTNAAMLTPATPPIKAASPKIVLNTVVGAVLGFLIGCVIALIQESARPRVRSMADLTEQFELPVLVSMPNGQGGTSGGAMHGLPKLTHLNAHRLPALQRANS